MGLAETRAELEAILSHLQEFPDITGCAIVRKDGLMIASSLSPKIDSRAIGAMAAAIVGTAETAIGELHLGKFPQIIAEAEKGKLVATGAGGQALLVCMVRATANLGLVLLEMGRASERISSKLE